MGLESLEKGCDIYEIQYDTLNTIFQRLDIARKIAHSKYISYHYISLF